MIYPRGRWGFAVLALTASVSRVIVHAHFPTDIAAGLILGAGWAFACHLGFAAPVFDLVRAHRLKWRRTGTPDPTVIAKARTVPLGILAVFPTLLLKMSCINVHVA